MLASELTRLQIDCLIIDASSGPRPGSRATLIHARSLERFDVLGIGDRAVAEGRRLDGLAVNVQGRPAAWLPFAEAGQAETAHPYVLALEQDRTEALLLASFEDEGPAVQWQTRLLSRVEHEDRVDCTVERPDGRVEVVSADWVVGCDGASGSVVLAASAGAAEGRKARETREPRAVVVVDTSISADLPADRIQLALSDQAFALFLPLPEAHRFRVVATLAAGAVNLGRDGASGWVVPGPDIAPALLAEVGQVLAAETGLPLVFDQADGLAVFRAWPRCVDRLRSGRCFLAGDSAHVHSPAAGQGLNTGLLDASNLAWKLAWVQRGLADESLLDSYHDERQPVALALLRTTDRAFDCLIDRRWPLARMRRLWLPGLARRFLARPRVRQALFRRLSQIGLAYRHSALARPSQPALVGAMTVMAQGRLSVRPGERLPHVVVVDPGSGAPLALHRRLVGAGFHLLVLDRRGDPGPIAASWAARLRQTAVGEVDVLALRPGEGADELFAVLQVESAAVLLVRPDHYLGYVSTRLSLPPLLAWVEQALPAPDLGVATEGGDRLA